MPISPYSRWKDWPTDGILFVLRVKLSGCQYNVLYTYSLSLSRKIEEGEKSLLAAPVPSLFPELIPSTVSSLVSDCLLPSTKSGATQVSRYFILHRQIENTMSPCNDFQWTTSGITCDPRRDDTARFKKNKPQDTCTFKFSHDSLILGMS